MSWCTRICTGIVEDDASATALSERVDEIQNDHDGARVKWIQTAVHGKQVGDIADEGRVRLTAIIVWRD
jgi:hypothetical protein